MYFLYEKGNLEEVSKSSKARMGVTPKLEHQMHPKYVDFDHVTICRTGKRDDMHTLPDHKEWDPLDTITVTLWTDDIKTTMHLIMKKCDARVLAYGIRNVLTNDMNYGHDDGFEHLSAPKFRYVFGSDSYTREAYGKKEEHEVFDT